MSEVITSANVQTLSLGGEWPEGPWLCSNCFGELELGQRYYRCSKCGAKTVIIWPRKIPLEEVPVEDQ